jgi:hypothetical protein
MFYKAVAQSVILYDSETWVITSHMLKMLQRFHRRVARRLTGRAPIFHRDTGVWMYPPLGNALRDAEFYSMSEYITRRRTTITRCVKQSPLFKLCRETVTRPEMLRNQLLCWDQIPICKCKATIDSDNNHSRTKA